MSARIMPKGVDTFPDRSRVPSRFTTLSPQRGLMRELFRTFGNDQGAVCLAYIEAERDGEVELPCGAETMAAGVHAATLWWEGRPKGWLAS